VLLESRKAPSITEVFMVEFCFSTPRIIMHMCRASMTTATPAASVTCCCVGDLPGEVFLNLQAPGEHVHQPRDLRQAQHLAGGNISHMGLADEGQQVMFAQRVQLDVGDDDHLIVVGAKQRPLTISSTRCS
jgi:hypothetical protein